MRYKITDTGCYADETLGHAHLRDRLADLIRTLPEWNDEMEGVCASLDGPMPDDAGDEYEALEILQEFTDEGIFWEIEQGLYLTSPD